MRSHDLPTSSFTGRGIAYLCYIHHKPFLFWWAQYESNVHSQRRLGYSQVSSPLLSGPHVNVYVPIIFPGHSDSQFLSVWADTLFPSDTKFP